MITDNTAKWKAVKLTEFAGKSLPVGFMHFSLEKEVPAGELPASGYLYNRTLYADLWAYAQERGLVISESEWQAQASANDGNCTYYSSGDGSTTFRVPKIPNTIVGDVPSDVPVVGNGMTLGLTDGAVYEGMRLLTDSAYRLTSHSGLYGSNVGTVNGGASSITKNGISVGVTTDPTKSGIVAKMSSTKTTGQWLIVAVGTVSNIGNADVANVMQAVEQVQTALGNIKDANTPFMPNYNAGVQIQSAVTGGRTYTVPANGVIQGYLNANGSGGGVIWYNNNKFEIRGADDARYLYFPVLKGDTIKGDGNTYEDPLYFYPYIEVV